MVEYIFGLVIGLIIGYCLARFKMLNTFFELPGYRDWNKKKYFKEYYKDGEGR